MTTKETMCYNESASSTPLLASSGNSQRGISSRLSLYYITCSSVILFPLPWVIEGKGITNDACLYTFPLQFILTLDMISKCDSPSVNTNTVTRLFMFLHIFNLSVFAYLSTATAALISSQLLCWLLFLETKLSDVGCMSHLMLLGYIYSSLIYAAMAVDDLDYVMDKSTIILCTLIVGLIMKMICGYFCWRHKFVGMKEGLSWLALTANAFIFILFVVTRRMTDFFSVV